MGQAPSLLDELPPDLSTTFVGGFPILSCLIDLTGLAQVHKWSYKNNGVPFRDEDWSRLKKIGT